MYERVRLYVWLVWSTFVAYVQIISDKKYLTSMWFLKIGNG